MTIPTERIIFLVLILVFTASCEKLDLSPKSFFALSMEETRADSLDSIYLRAKLEIDRNDAVNIEVIDYGFYWSTNPREMPAEDADRKVIPKTEPIGPGESFEAYLPVSSSSQTFYIQAFARYKDPLTDRIRDRVSPVVSYAFDQVRVSVTIRTDQPEDIIQNDKIRLSGAITGLNNIGGEIEDYGFVLSTAPIGAAADGSNLIHFNQTTDQNTSFDSLFTVDRFNTCYFIKGFIEYEGEIILSPDSAVVSVGDGWKLRARLPAKYEIADGGVWALQNGDVFFGLGCSFPGCPAEGSYGELWKLDPSSGEVKEAFTISLPDSLKRYDFVAFHHNNKIYFGLGEAAAFNNSSESLQDLYVLDPYTKELDTLPKFPGRPRSGAVAEVIGDSVYIGLGESASTFNDMYALSLEDWSGGWQALPPAPIFDCPNLQMGTAGRARAVSQVFDQKIVIGLGQASGQILLQDFILFDPATSSWQQIACSPERSSSGVALAFGDHLYFGLGETRNFTYTEGWYQLDPRSTSGVNVQMKTAFPGELGDGRIAFSHRGKGYVLGGKREKEIGENDYYSELWEYTPPTQQSICP